MKIKFAALLLFIVTTGFIYYKPIEKLSLSLTAKTLYNGKHIEVKGDVFFRASGGVLITHFTYPKENFVITNANGEVKMYDPASNSVILSQGLNYSSENSFIYQFLNGKANDMGLAALGFKLKETKVEDKLVITRWLPPVNMAESFGMAELVLKDHQPIFMSFKDGKNQLMQKVYYSNYQKVEHLQIPLTITEIQFLANGDSSITKKSYSNIKLNENVDNHFFNYRIPANAKVIK